MAGSVLTQGTHRLSSPETFTKHSPRSGHSSKPSTKLTNQVLHVEILVGRWTPCQPRAGLLLLFWDTLASGNSSALGGL